MPVDPRFSGIARLYGKRSLDHFREATVWVVGIGGVGSWACEALARSGLGRLVLVDADDICLTNTNRQIHATQGSYGRPKVMVMAERLRTIAPEIEVTAIQEFYSARNAERLFRMCPDAVLDAVDALRAKAHLVASCREREIPVVTSGAAGGRADPTRIHWDDLARSGHDPLLASLRRSLRAEYGFPAAGPGKAIPLFGVDAVFSDERPVYPTCDGGISTERPAGMRGSIGCDAGYGTATQVTAAFGLVCASRILERLRVAGR